MVRHLIANGAIRFDWPKQVAIHVSLNNHIVLNQYLSNYRLNINNYIKENLYKTSYFDEPYL